MKRVAVHVRELGTLRKALSAVAERHPGDGIRLEVYFPAEEKLSAAGVEAVVRAVSGLPVERIEILSNDPGAGLFSSTLGLRLPQARVTVSSLTPQPPEPPPALAAFESPAANDMPMIAPRASEESWSQGMSVLRASLSPGAIVAFSDTARPEPARLESLGEALRQNRHLRALALVNAGAGAAVIASSLKLRCPQLAVKAFEQEGPARQWLRRKTARISQVLPERLRVDQRRRR